MKPRREYGLGALLALVSVIAVTSTVLLALTQPTRTGGGPMTASLPDSLFERDEATTKSAPVALTITDELAAPPPDSPSPSPSASAKPGRPPAPGSRQTGPSGTTGGGPAPQPGGSTTSPSPSPNPTTSPNPSPSPTQSPAAMTLSLSGVRKQSGQSKVVVYTGVVRSTGGSSLTSLEFTSHVPSGTQWSPNRNVCNGNGYLVKVSASNGDVRNICIPGTSVIPGSSDTSTHPLSIRLSDPIPPGASVSIEYVFEIVNTSQTLTNHAHASASGVRADSGSVST